MNTTVVIIIGVVIVAAIVYALRDKVRGKPVPDKLRPGQPFPPIVAIDEDGKPVSSADLAGKPAVLLFVRGSWCPFCSKQVVKLTEAYKEITDTGARLILITPKPLETTKRVAKLFELDFEFWLDDSLEIGKSLGLLHKSGVPGKYREEYGADTLWPTSLVIGADGIIQFTELSRFIADRPSPEKLLKIVRKL